MHESVLSRRLALRLIGVSAGTALLAACGVQSPAAPATSAPAPATVAPATSPGCPQTRDRGIPGGIARGRRIARWRHRPRRQPRQCPRPRAARQPPSRGAAASSSTRSSLISARSTATSARQAPSTASWLAFEGAHRVRREAPAAADAGPKLGPGAGLHADHLPPAAGRDLSHRPRVHQRRRQVEFASRAPAGRRVRSIRQPEQLVHHDRLPRQVHGDAQVRQPAARACSTCSKT